MSAQAKPISELIEDFEQSLENLRPSTKRVYMAGARAAIRAASLELWQSPSTTDLLASIGKWRTNHMEPKTSVKEFKLANDCLSGAVGRTHPRRVPVINDPYPRRKIARSLDDHALCTTLNAFVAL